MSSLASWSYRSVLTIWPTVLDEFNQPTYGEPYTLMGSWETGTKAQVDEAGTEFVPMKECYFEAPFDSELIPMPGAYLGIGDLTGQADPIQAGGERIRRVGGWDMAMFGANELPDWVIYTSA